MGYSFVIGLIAVIMSYLIGVPLGILMARKKDKLVDKIGTLYIVFIIAVPSLAYIFLFKAIGGSFGLPTTFDMESQADVYIANRIVSTSIHSKSDEVDKTLYDRPDEFGLCQIRKIRWSDRG